MTAFLCSSLFHVGSCWFIKVEKAVWALFFFGLCFSGDKLVPFDPLKQFSLFTKKKKKKRKPDFARTLSPKASRRRKENTESSFWGRFVFLSRFGISFLFLVSLLSLAVGCWERAASILATWVVIWWKFQAWIPLWKWNMWNSYFADSAASCGLFGFTGLVTY